MEKLFNDDPIDSLTEKGRVVEGDVNKIAHAFIDEYPDVPLRELEILLVNAIGLAFCEERMKRAIKIARGKEE